MAIGVVAGVVFLVFILAVGAEFLSLSKRAEENTGDSRARSEESLAGAPADSRSAATAAEQPAFGWKWIHPPPDDRGYMLIGVLAVSRPITMVEANELGRRLSDTMPREGLKFAIFFDELFARRQWNRNAKYQYRNLFYNEYWDHKVMGVGASPPKQRLEECRKVRGEYIRDASCRDGILEYSTCAVGWGSETCPARLPSVPEIWYELANTDLHGGLIRDRVIVRFDELTEVRIHVFAEPGGEVEIATFEAGRHALDHGLLVGMLAEGVRSDFQEAFFDLEAQRNAGKHTENSFVSARQDLVSRYLAHYGKWFVEMAKFPYGAVLKVDDRVPREVPHDWSPWG